jgi:hypothetical protein
MVNGTMPMNASPSNVSIASGSGTSGRSAAAGTRQCRNDSSRQRWYPCGGPSGRRVGAIRSMA